MLYTLSEAAKLAGVPQPTATRWVKAGVVQPEHHVGRQGVRVRLGEKELEELRTVAALRRAGLTFQSLRRAADELRRLGFNPFSGGLAGFAVIDGAHGRPDLVRVIGPEEAVNVSGVPGQMVLVPLFGELRAESKDEKGDEDRTGTA